MSGEANLAKAERLAEFFRRLQAAEACASLDEAFELVCGILNAVEDEFTDIPCNQETSDTDGRLYPPRRENLRDVKDHPGIQRHRHRFHNTFFGKNGAIEIQEVQTENVLLAKSGRDGRGVWK